MTPEQINELAAKIVEALRPLFVDMNHGRQVATNDAMRAAMRAQEQQRFNDLLAGVVAKQQARSAEQANVRHWVLAELVCTTCEQRSWGASEVGPRIGPKQCPRCLAMSCVGVLTKHESLSFLLGERHRVEVLLPHHECSHATHALRTIAFLASDLRSRGEL